MKRFSFYKAGHTTAALLFCQKDKWWKQLLPGLVFVLLLVFAYSVQAQVLTAPRIFFPLDGNHSVANPRRGMSAAPGKITNMSAVVDGTATTSTNHRHGEGSHIAYSFSESQRLEIANADGSNTNSSFFGINTTLSGYAYDPPAFTISCWVYINPADVEKRYIFYGVNNTGKLGFGLSHVGPDLFLIKYVNNATAPPGSKLSSPAVVGNSWEGSFRGPASFTAGEGWYHVILAQGPYYTRVFVGMPPEQQVNGKWVGKKGKFNKDFGGNMVMHGKQELTSFIKWGMGVPEGISTAEPVRKIDDFMVFDYDMTEAQAEALYHCQLAGPTESCFGVNQTYNQEFAIIGDYGCDGGVSADPVLNNPEEKVADMVKSWYPDFIISLGDDSYTGTDGCGHSYADNVGKYYGDYIDAENPEDDHFFPVMGNHDRDCPPGITPPYTCPGGTTSHYKCSCLWEDYFATETLAPGYDPVTNTAPNGGRYYTFTEGNIQFFGLNSNKEEPDGNRNTSIQANWLKDALANSTATFKVVYMHHPPYTSKAKIHGGNPVQDTMRTWNFKALGADIVIAGDNHFYERSDYKNLTYIVNGVGGYPGLSVADSFIVAGSRVHIEKKFGAVRVESNDSVMHFRFYSIDPTDPTNRSKDALGDEFWLHKRPDGATYARQGPKPVTTPGKPEEKTTPEEKSTVSTFSVFPNPTSGELTVRLNGQAEGNATLKIFDISGREVYTQKIGLKKGLQTIPLGNLKARGISAGMYFIRVISSKGTMSAKVVVQ